MRFKLDSPEYGRRAAVNMGSVRVSLALSRDLPIHEIIRCVRESEAKRFFGFWMHETYYLRESISTLAAAAMSTSKIKLGTCVINPYTRNPVLLAITFATLNELSKGRAMMGLGAGNVVLVKRMGIDNSKAVSGVEESIGVMRRLWSGEELSFSGRVFKISNVKIFEGNNHIPIYLAGTGRRMLNLGAKVADGILAYYESPNSISLIVERIRKMASRCGRDLSKLDVAPIILCHAGEDRGRTLGEIKRNPKFIRIVSLASRRRIADVGLDHSMVDRLRELYVRGDYTGAIKMIPDDIVEMMVATGRVDSIVDRARAVVKSGVSHVILEPLSGADPNPMSKVLEAGQQVINLFSE